MDTISSSYKNTSKDGGEFTGTIPKGLILPFFESLVEKNIADKQVDGFRKGNAPKDLAMQNIDTMECWGRAARLAIAAQFPKMVKAQCIEPIAPPDLQFTKIAYNNDVEYSLSVLFIPDFDIPDYQELANETEKTEVKKSTEEEVSKVLREIQVGLHREQNAEEEITDTTILPAITDEVVAKLGSSAKTIEEFKKIVSTNLNMQHQQTAKEKTRSAFFDKLLEIIKIDIPDIVIDAEVALYINNLEKSAEKMKISKEEYLKKINKTEEELRVAFKSDATKRATIQLALNKIAKREKVEVDGTIVEEETEKILKRDPKANKEQIYIYIETLMLNEEVFKKLGL